MPRLIEVGVSAAATALALALLARAVWSLLLDIRRRRAGALGSPERIPDMVAGWLGLAAFAAGMLAGRLFWA